MLLANTNFNLDEIQSDFSADTGAIAFKTIGDVITKLLPYFLAASGILLLIFLIFSGFQLMASSGDPKAAQAAKSRITGSLVGFVIIFTAFWIVQIVGKAFNIEQITDIFGK